MSEIKFPSQCPSRTKIVATVGPACDNESTLTQLMLSGVTVFRLNMAHGAGTEDAQRHLDLIRLAASKLSRPIGVLVDLAGPKMRLGEIPGGTYICNPEIPMRFVRGSSTTEPNTFTTTYEQLIDDLRVGDNVMLADGTVTLRVSDKDSDSVVCEVVQGGAVRSRQGVNLPGVNLSIRTLQPHDIVHAKWAVEACVDFLGLSFVRSAEDIHELREILAETAHRNTGLFGEIPHIIAKIEKQEAVDNIEEITDAANGVMVARGDLGVELDIAQIATVQKMIIDTCRRKLKPVIVATQMLESMHSRKIPTRAEATDVANAILDGADATMLSGETAVGEYPVDAVKMMNRIAEETEKSIAKYSWQKQDIRNGSRLQSVICAHKTGINGQNENGVNENNLPVTSAICSSAVELAETIKAKRILIASRSGVSVMGLSNCRSSVQIIGTSHNPRVLNRMNLYWGVIPILNAPNNPRESLKEIVEVGKKVGRFERGDRLVLVSIMGTSSENHNIIYVHIVD
ncbi:MAG: pyruvate kinase [Planctomycetaceae bacterium]|nr:pyruvate kinase [Planctomycetaceae bacterium]